LFASDPEWGLMSPHTNSYLREKKREQGRGKGKGRGERDKLEREGRGEGRGGEGKMEGIITRIGCMITWQP